MLKGSLQNPSVISLVKGPSLLFEQIVSALELNFLDLSYIVA